MLPSWGSLKKKDGDRYLLSDQVQITAYIRERFQTEKVMIFAHSMGNHHCKESALYPVTQLRKGGTERIPELSGNTDYPHRVFPDESAHKGACDRCIIPSWCSNCRWEISISR